MEPFHRSKILFFWAAYEAEYPFPSVIQMDLPRLMEFRKEKQNNPVWYGKVVDLDYLIRHAETINQSVYVYGFSYLDDNECAYIELHDRIDPPNQPSLI